MTIGEFREWCDDLEITDDFKLCVRLTEAGSTERLLDVCEDDLDIDGGEEQVIIHRLP